MLTLSKISSSIIAISMLCPGCFNSDKNRNSPPENKNILNIGHAGSGFNYLFMPFNPYPTNSFQSLKNALANGADGVEVDLQLTADHKLVLFHDFTLESNTDLKGYIINFNSTEIVGVPYECGFPYDLFQNEKIISLPEWLNYAHQLPQFPYLHIDLKTNNNSAESMAGIMLNVLFENLKTVEYPLEKVILISGDYNVITKILTEYPMLNCAYQPAEFNEGLSWVQQHGCKFMIIDQKRLTGNDVKTAHEKGIRVIAMGGRAESTLLKLIEMKPDFIQSNNVKMLHHLLQ